MRRIAYSVAMLMCLSVVLGENGVVSQARAQSLELPPIPQLSSEPEDSLPSVEKKKKRKQKSNEPQMLKNDFGVSLMYKDVDVRNLEQVLAAIKGKTQDEIIQQAEPNEADILAEILAAARQGDEPTETPEVTEVDVVLPAFYLSSIIYRNPGDWTLWINRERLTPKSASNGAGIAVKGISKELVTIAWTPEDKIAAVKRWTELKENQDGPRSRKHLEGKMAKIDFDQETGEFIVSMRPNQTFSADTMQVLEGRHAITRVAIESEPEVENEPDLRQGAEQRDPLATEKNLANQLLNNVKQLGDITPTRDK